MTNVLVTGGAGYIGSHACKSLKQAGYVPVTYDNLVTGWQDAVRLQGYPCTTSSAGGHHHDCQHGQQHEATSLHYNHP